MSISWNLASRVDRLMTFHQILHLPIAIDEIRECTECGEVEESCNCIEHTR